MIFRVKHALTKSQIIRCTPTQVHKGIEHVIGMQRNVFTKKAHCLVYTCDCAPAEHFRAYFVSQALLAASDLDALRICCILATDRPPIRGWGRPNAQSQVLIS